MGNVKDKFGRKFLDIFQKTLVQTINNSGGDPTQMSQFNHYKSTFAKGNKLGQSNNEISDFMVYNYPNYDNIYKLARHNNSDNQFTPVRTGFQSLQSNLDYFRVDENGISRRLINKYGIPQKHWPNGRPRGSLERHTGNSLRGKYMRVEQGLGVGIQGMAMTRQNRIFTGQEPVKHNKLFKSNEKLKKQSFTQDEVLSAVEKLCAKYGTPITLKGHKEAILNQINNNEELRHTLLSSNRNSKKSYFSVPSSNQKERTSAEVLPPMQSIQSYQFKEIQHAKSIYLASSDGVPSKKYLLSYMNSKDSEKEKIINLFTKIFKEFQFNKKEDKDLILRHIR